MSAERDLVTGIGWRQPVDGKPTALVCVYCGNDVEACERALLAAIDSGAIFYARTFRGGFGIPFFAASKTNRPQPVGAVVFPPGSK